MIRKKSDTVRSVFGGAQHWSSVGARCDSIGHYLLFLSLLIACADNSTIIGRIRDLNVDAGSQTTRDAAANIPERDAGIALGSCDPGSCSCNDGIDNDGDGLVDWQFDLGCTELDDSTEGGVLAGTVENGWTVFEHAPDSQVIYVTSDGDDSLDGLSPRLSATGSGPKRTLAAGVRELRDGYPDWLLLKRGDVFDEQLHVSVSGRNAREPLVIASYGESLVRPGILGGIAIEADAPLSHIAVVHLSTEAEGVVATETQGLTLEGLAVMGGGIQVEGGADARIRRNVVSDSPAASISTQGHVGVLIEENISYQSEGPGVSVQGGGDATLVRANLVYFSELYEGEAHGIEQRSGGVSEENVIVNCRGYGIAMAECEGITAACPNPIDVARLSNNVFIEGLHLGGGPVLFGNWVEPGQAILEDNLVMNTKADVAAVMTYGSGVVVRNNVLLESAMGLSAGAQDVTWEGNVLFSESPPLVLLEDLQSNVDTFTALRNRYFSPSGTDGWFVTPELLDFDEWQASTGETGSGAALQFQDPTRSLSSYNRGLGSDPWSQAYFLQTLSQTKFAYRAEYSASPLITYLREGFTLRQP